jgi:hypothetical protein
MVLLQQCIVMRSLTEKEKLRLQRFAFLEVLSICDPNRDALEHLGGGLRIPPSVSVRECHQHEDRGSPIETLR